MKKPMTNEQLLPAGSVLVEIYNPISKSSDWHIGTVRGYCSGDVHEDFQRINVTLKSGIEIDACHPDCVKEDLLFEL